ncbi:MAG TPA: carbohydrate ABC transporter substrate-binding protein [Clostridiaceae bacterium]|nr:carbohydrate ABC transporter substrate-binding protein [Clostridiaceae bacterium]
MKKYLAIFLALTMVLTFAVSCGNGEEPEETPAPVETDVPEDTEEPDETEDPGETEEPEVTDAPETGIEASIVVQVETDWMGYYQAAADRVIAQNPGSTIELMEVASFDHIDTLDQTDATNPDVADLFALPADRLTNMAGKDLLGAIDSKAIAAAAGGWDDFDAGLGGLFVVDGEYLAFPFNIETLIVFANKANAETEGIDLSAPVEMNDMEHPAHILLPAFDAWFGVALTNSADIDLLAPEGDAFVSDFTKDWADLEPEKQAAIEALYDYWKLNADSNTTLFDAEAGWGYIDDQFTSGNAGVLRIGGPWETGGMKEKTNDGADLGIYNIDHITVAGQPLRHWQGGWGLAINPRIEEDDNQVALAEAMIAEIVNPDFAEDLFRATGKILENVTAEEYAASGLDDIDKTVIAATIESFDISPGRPLYQEFNPVWDTWKNGVLSWNTVQPENVEAAYAELKASFDAMMSN